MNYLTTEDMVSKNDSQQKLRTKWGGRGRESVFNITEALTLYS